MPSCRRKSRFAPKKAASRRRTATRRRRFVLAVVANMYFIPIALLIKDFASADFWTAIAQTPAQYAALTWSAFLARNLVPVTLGNVIGGAGMVGAVYWFVFLRRDAKTLTSGRETSAHMPVSPGSPRPPDVKGPSIGTAVD